MQGSTKKSSSQSEKKWPAINREPYFENDSVRLYQGDCLELLSEMEVTHKSRFDAVITDPPYCSGAVTKSGRDAAPATKYCQDGKTLGRPSFTGDSRDPRSFVFWSTMWFAYARRLCRPSAYGLVFIDWRQLPVVTDVYQASGWTWKGICVWNKGRGARAPHKGYFRHQSEFIVWGTNGKVPKLLDRGPFDGVHSIPIRQSDKHHITGKPTPLLRELVQVAPVDGLILDPFAGSGTTGVSATLEGRRAILIEQSEECCQVAAKRLEAAAVGEQLPYSRAA